MKVFAQAVSFIYRIQRTRARLKCLAIIQTTCQWQIEFTRPVSLPSSFRLCQNDSLSFNLYAIVPNESTHFNQGVGWEAWPYDHPYHLIMNLAVGGWWGRAGGPIDDSIFPTRMEVDYVRVFKQSQPDE